MKTKTRPFIWLLLFIIVFVLFSSIAFYYSEPREIKISEQQAKSIGDKIWLNEGAGKLDNLIVWNEGEDFPSLGIGHFIWYPRNVEPTFTESFPNLLSTIAKTREIPDWLRKNKYPPWQSRKEFISKKYNTETVELRTFLQKTIVEQTQFITNRLEAALPKIINEIKDPFRKRHVRRNFYRVAEQENGVYTLVDYVNFKGEGTASRERYNNLGWGLAQVLERMSGKSTNPLAEFVTSADEILTRRVQNAPRDERKWLPGWRKRLQTYLNEQQKGM